mmetsp:Transcript_35430/g.89704  ORF Transcript_35430/g.89704 Transcript_35430/m.89704 type:complete len:152 (-) Transcript_35430:211-666(-)
MQTVCLPSSSRMARPFTSRASSRVATRLIVRSSEASAQSFQLPTTSSPCSSGVPLEKAGTTSTCAGTCGKSGQCAGGAGSASLQALMAGGVTGTGTMNTLMGKDSEISRREIEAAFSMALPGQASSQERVLNIGDLLVSVPDDFVFQDDEE